jgi:hypothetical protein
MWLIHDNSVLKSQHRKEQGARRTRQPRNEREVAVQGDSHIGGTATEISLQRGAVITICCSYLYSVSPEKRDTLSVWASFRHWSRISSSDMLWYWCKRGQVFLKFAGFGWIQSHNIYLCCLNNFVFVPLFQFTLGPTHYMKWLTYSTGFPFQSFTWRLEKHLVFSVSISMLLHLHPKQFRAVVFTQTTEIR